MRVRSTKDEHKLESKDGKKQRTWTQNETSDLPGASGRRLQDMSFGLSLGRDVAGWDEGLEDILGGYVDERRGRLSIGNG
jgi:hypothetical protein